MTTNDKRVNEPASLIGNIKIWFSADAHFITLSDKADSAARLERTIALAGFYTTRSLAIAAVVAVVVAIAAYTPVLSAIAHVLGRVIN